MPNELELNASIFREHLHTRFKVAGAGDSLELELVEVQEHPSSPKLECYSLFFHGPNSLRMPQGTHRLHHSALGELEFFLTAVAGDRGGFTYESVFNRFRKQNP
jgi:hypothetical protein